MKILIILVLTILYVITTVYLYKTYEKSKLSAKLTEMIILETLGYVFLGLILLNPNKEHNLVSIIDILQWISFFCFFFFLFYYDYGNHDGSEESKELNSKKEIFLHFVKRSGSSNIVVRKNKKFIFFLAIYISLEIVKALI